MDGPGLPGGRPGDILSGPVPADGPDRAGERPREEAKYEAVEVSPYTDDDIDRIDAQYGSESPLGPTPAVGKTCRWGTGWGPMVKGPLTVTDMICWHVGMGMGLYGVKPLRLGYQNRQRIPRFFHRDDLNVPDVMQRVHWDPDVRPARGKSDDFRLRTDA